MGAFNGKTGYFVKQVDFADRGHPIDILIVEVDKVPLRFPTNRK